MIALDTNIVVRLITRDHPLQAKRARALILERSGYIQSTVLPEVEWVLRSTYRFGKAQITQAFRLLGQTDDIELQCADRLDAILAAYENGIDFGDAIHLHDCPVATFATYDRVFAVKAHRAFPEMAVITP